MSGFWHDLWAVLWLATWGNNVAWLESLILAGLTAWIAHKTGLLRKLTEHTGHHLAAWWDRHHGPHAVKRHKQALREHDEETRRLPR